MLNSLDIAHLRTLKVDYGETSAVAGSYETDLSRIEQIISNYKEAKKVATYSTFYSVSDANTKIQNAEKYRTMDPLSNCKDLTNKLATVKSNIGNSHYNQVKSKINEMANYRNMEEPLFNSLMSSVNGSIKEYDNNCHNYGPSAKTTNELKKEANEYYLKAREYYANMNREINIFTNNQWSSMSSPNNQYRAYQSTTYNKPNSEAIMSFTIKGYDSFSFYVRSNGEANFDYLMVGLNSRPTVDSNYFNTKGFPSSGTNVSDYRRVTFSGLEKSWQYTIYVVYKKDFSGNGGTDRGYVLIPYENN